MYCKILVLCTLLNLRRINTTLVLNQYVEQNEMSEYCRRRVIPSVFLGKSVKDCNLNVLHFSRLEMPYSCMTSVRTESGNNIILVIKLQTEIGLHKACAHNKNQLVVYELGETYGGYWGPIPGELMVQPRRNVSKYYTLKTTKAPEIVQDTEEPVQTSLKTKSTRTDVETSTKEEKEYVTLEIPIVTISGNFELPQLGTLQDVADGFDAIYDVMPRNGVKYRTSMLPLVEFSIRKQTEIGGEYALRNNKPLYDLDYSIYRGDGVTLDPRLTFSTAHRRFLTKKSNWSASRLLRFKHRRNKLFSRKSTTYALFRGPKVTMRKNTIKPEQLVLNDDNTISTIASRPTTNTDYWYLIDNIIKSYNVSENAKRTENATAAEKMEKIYNMEKTNVSAYLFSDLSSYDGHSMYNESQNSSDPVQLASIMSKVDSTTRYYDLNKNFTPNTVSDFVYLNASIEHTTLKGDNSHAKIVENKTTDANNISIDKNTIGENFIRINSNDTDTVRNMSELDLHSIAQPNLSDTLKTSRVPITGSLVDHESWENIVQVAPAMATALETDDLENKNNSNLQLFPTLNKKREGKKKRFIESLDIEKSRPRNLTTKLISTAVAQTPSTYDMQDLAHLIEIEDDEIQGRVALGYLRNYIGPVLFNICDYSYKQNTRVKLLNSSRIVIALGNYTLGRMMLTMTPALAMLNNKAQCPLSHLECQIMGTRVCIDAMNACDGVPNCGANDIYDEDRIVCSKNSSTQYMFFAALAFLAVILTFMYTIHYCFTRCVPKVSEAFFIYTDNAENILYLDTVMRSPRDDDDIGDLEKFFSPTQFEDSDLMCADIKKTERVSKSRKLVTRFLNFILFKKKVLYDSTGLNQQTAVGTKKGPYVFSFTELELNKMIHRKDVITQTGDSLEMKDVKIKKNVRGKLSIESLRILDDENINPDFDSYVNELALMKAVNRRKSSVSDINIIGKMDNNLRKVISKETELNNTIYENKLPASDNKPTPKLIYDLPEEEESIEKHLRFKEYPTFIPSNYKLPGLDLKHSAGSSTDHKSLAKDIAKNVSKPMKTSSSPFRIWNSSKGRKYK